MSDPQSCASRPERPAAPPLTPVHVTPAQRALLIDACSTYIAAETRLVPAGFRPAEKVLAVLCELVRLRTQLSDVSAT